MVDYITNTTNIFVFNTGLLTVWFMYQWYKSNILSDMARQYIVSFGMIVFAMSMRAGYYGLAGLIAERGEQYDDVMTHNGIFLAVAVAIVYVWGAIRFIREVEGFSVKTGCVIFGWALVIAAIFGLFGL